ncbi:hypothetical protein [Prosthecomicrobium sp. N25]|uniref:hypothetical protein n=1 Tax=Prosthecomicrobium sp. N25 TaxID=3129254 RepID=UPI003077113B
MDLTATILTDLSANVFAVFVLVLMLALAAPKGRDATPPASLEAATLGARAAKPLDPDAMVAMLHRRGEPGGVSVDVFADRVVLLSSDGTSVLTGAAPAGALAGLPPDRRVDVFVFSAGRYGAVAAALDGRAGVAEMSVPGALRRPPGTGEGWSRGFERLQARRLDRQAFRSELAALVAGAGRDRADAPAGGRGAAGGTGLPGGTPPEDLSARLAAMLTRGLDALALLAIAVLAGFAERRRRRA